MFLPKTTTDADTKRCKRNGTIVKVLLVFSFTRATVAASCGAFTPKAAIKTKYRETGQNTTGGVHVNYVEVSRDTCTHLATLLPQRTGIVALISIPGVSNGSA